MKKGYNRPFGKLIVIMAFVYAILRFLDNDIIFGLIFLCLSVFAFIYHTIKK